MLGAVEFLHAFDGDRAGSGAFDFCAHGDEEICEIDDFGFLGGSVDDGGAIRQNGGHHDISGAEDCGAKCAAEGNSGPGELGSENLHIAAADLHGRAEGLEAAQVEIDRSVADDAATWKRNGGLMLATEQWAENANGGAHFAHDVVGGLGGDFFGPDLNRATRSLHLASEFAEDGEHVVDVAQVGNTRDRAGFLCEKGGGEYRERGVF